eukprot:145317-Chlamydomonas_euryale.AAC.1
MARGARTRQLQHARAMPRLAHLQHELAMSILAHRQRACHAHISATGPILVHPLVHPMLPSTLCAFPPRRAGPSRARTCCLSCLARSLTSGLRAPLQSGSLRPTPRAAQRSRSM